VRDNDAIASGAGIYLGDYATLTLGASSTVDLTSAATGGGVYKEGGTISGPYCRTLIHDNQPDDCAP
jgi:hypothetical protein